MAIIDHGVFTPYTPDNPEMFGGRPALYLRNEAGQDWYDLSKTIAPGAALVEVFPNGFVFGFTGQDGEEVDYTTRWPADRRLLEVRPPRNDLKGMVWDGSDFVAPEPPISEITKRQLRLWLVRNGVALATVEAAIDAMPEPARTEAQIEWNDASVYSFANPLVVEIGAAIGLTDIGMLKQAFRDAALI